MSRQQEQSQQRDEFQAYGEYSYDYVHQPEGQEQPQQAPAGAAMAKAQKKRSRRKTEGFFKFLIVLTALTVALVIVQERFFRLQYVYVIGNEKKTSQQIAAVSGLVKGRNMLGIEEADIAKAMSKDHTIIFKGMQKEYPGVIYLYIEERNVTAAMQWLGVLYLLDDEGMVMEQRTDSTLPEGLPVVTGFKAGNIYVGQKLTLRSATQLEAYQTIIEELQLQLYTDQVSEINLSDPENIYLITREGVTVRLGDGSQMESKIGSVRTAMAYLRQLGSFSGVLDVTQPQSPTFMPES